MKKYIKKGLFFSIPFVLIFIFIFIVDPYEFINISHIIKSEYKIESYKRSDESSPRGAMLWKVIHYARNPKANLIIGDSQGKNISESLIKEISGKDFYNFCIPGSSYETMFQTFWFTVDQCELESVYFQVGFMNYSGNRSYSLFHFAQDYVDDPYLYFVKKDILFDSFFNAYYQISKDPALVQRSYEYDSFEKLDELSNYRLKLFFSDYSYPFEYYMELKKIVDYCHEKEIDVKFIILPTYYKTIEYLESNNLITMKDKFKDDIKSLGFVYDFDQPNEITKSRENFSDYFHPKNHIINKLTIEIWNQ